jgi:hypothetical protein
MSTFYWFHDTSGKKFLINPDHISYIERVGIAKPRCRIWISAHGGYQTGEVDAPISEVCKILNIKISETEIGKKDTIR